MKADIKKIEAIMAAKCLKKKDIAARAGWSSAGTLTNWFNKIRNGWDLQPKTIGKLAFDFKALQHRPDLRPSAMDDNGIHTGLLEQDNVAGKKFRQFRVAHGMAAIFDHDGLLVIALQMWQSFRQDFGLRMRRRQGIAHNLLFALFFIVFINHKPVFCPPFVALPSKLA